MNMLLENHKISFPLAVSIGFTLATSIFIFDIINERTPSILSIIFRYSAGIIFSAAFKKYSDYYALFIYDKVNSPVSFKKWLVCTFIWGISYIGAGFGTICNFILLYILYFCSLPSDFGALAPLIIDIYLLCFTVGFIAGNFFCFCNHLLVHKYKI